MYRSALMPARVRHVARTHAVYNRTAIVLHWLVAALILVNFSLGLHMEHFPGYKHSSPEWSAVLFWHASVGAVVLWLAVGRVIWRTTHSAPPLPARIPGWQAFAAHAVHGLLYVLMIALPLTGYVHRMAGNHPISFFGLWNWPAIVSPDEPLRLLTDKIHVGLAYTVGALVLAHLAAVAKHTLIDRDGLLKRMTTWR